jgi:hypothetical protein
MAPGVVVPGAPTELGVPELAGAPPPAVPPLACARAAAETTVSALTRIAILPWDRKDFMGFLLNALNKSEIVSLLTLWRSMAFRKPQCPVAGLRSIGSVPYQIRATGVPRSRALCKEQHRQ